MSKFAKNNLIILHLTAELQPGNWTIYMYKAAAAGFEGDRHHNFNIFVPFN